MTPPLLGAPSKRMPFLSHLGELRKRLIYSLIFVSIATAVAFHFSPQIFIALMRPLAFLPTNKMIALGPLEIFVTYIKLALLSALLGSSPFLFFQLWQFIAPGLYPHERRWVVPFVCLASGSFIGGAAFCFFLVLPTSFQYLISLTPPMVESHYSVSLYFSLITQLMLAFGIVFELPLVMTVLAFGGMVTHRHYTRFRRYWIVLAAIIGGVLTPTPDPMTQMMMAVPLVIFFEIGILGAKLVEKRSERVGL